MQKWNKAKKKPVIIDSILWDGDEETLKEIMTLCPPQGLPKAPDDPHIHSGYGFTPSDGRLFIPTLEGTMCAQPGDYILRGIKGEVYPCKPDIYQGTYEVVESSPDKEKG